MIGQTISHYRILAELGGGGMGIVYRAEDLRLGREVALKFLPPDLAQQPDALERFQREARLASSLNHPHICTVHDIGEHLGQHFIVMELLEGATLRTVIDGRPMPIDQLVDVAIQVAGALDGAHRRGIIHRDIKPANVFITRQGNAKVLDFGLAKLEPRRPGADPRASSATHSRVEAELTSPGLQVGTMAYMSPEQARGEPLDHRTDLFSFGALLYEMATGRRAFPGTTALVLDGVLNQQPIPPRVLNATVPPELEAIIEKAMEKSRDLRYQGAADLLADLRRLKRLLDSGRSSFSFATAPPDATTAMVDSGPSAAAASGRWRRAGWLAGGVAVVGLLVGVLTAVFSGRSDALTDRDSVLLADLVNATGDPVFDGTLGQALEVQLAQSPFLDIVPDSRVDDTLRLMGREPRDAALTGDLAREVCQRLGVKAMLQGSIASLGNLYVLTLEASNCETGASLAREQGEARSREEVLKVLGSIGSSMRGRLGESLASIERFDVPIERATTPSLEALRAYTLGVAQRARGAEVEAIPFFERAIELDPGFAAAYNALSIVYGTIGEWARSEEYARLAYERREHVSERERLLITYQFHDRVTGDQLRAAETLQVWKQSYPRDFTPANALALTYIRLGDYARAVEEAGEAMRRNPAHPFPYSNQAYAYRGLGDYDAAKRVALEAVSRGIETIPTRRLLYQIGELQHDAAAIEAHLTWGRSSPRAFDLLAAQAQVLAYRGRMAAARDLFRQAGDMAVQRGLAETAEGYLAQQAWTDALYGNAALAGHAARQALSGAAEGQAGPLPRYRAIAALAWTGQLDEAVAIATRTEQRYPESTLTRAVLVPVTHAIVALRRKDPARAIEALRAASAYELGTVAALVPVYLRGEAERMRRDGRAALEQYEAILEHRGADPFSPVCALAHLGIARASGLMGDAEASRRAYEAFLALWGDADADLPVLQEARSELAALAGGTSAP